MAVQSNGRAKKPKKAVSNGTLNGNLNGGLNGHMNGHTNGHAEKSQKSGAIVRSSKSRPRKTTIGSLTNIFGRLISWYFIITVFFRCPSSISHITDSTPQVCKPYLHARSYVTPYLDPYYHTYIAPQVEKVQPYIDRIDKQVYTPVSTFTKDKYATYGSHRVAQTQKYAEAQWERTVRPQLQKAQTQAKGQYDVYLSPHVKQVSNAAAPYYEQTKDSLAEIYHLTVLPAYEVVLPYSHQAYVYGNHVLAHIVFPHVRSVKDAGWTFITRTLWPQLRVLYGDNVEPQLVRIQERLGRYKDQQKMESAVDALESDPLVLHSNALNLSKMDRTVIHNTAVITSSTTAPSETATKSGWELLDDIFGPESASTVKSEVEAKTATQPAQPKLTGDELQEKLNDDLRKWQTKFATAADKGAEDLELRVEEITKRQIENGVKGHGAALVVQLEETADSTVANFKKYIKKIVKALPEDATEEQLEAAYEQCTAKTRDLGIAVKEKAQAVRTWKAAYDQETDSLVQAAVSSTVEVLEKIHGLGLQEVGMRWAWTDGVTYKDWQKYHKLRNTLTEWQAEVEAVGSRHEGLRAAHEEAKNIEDGAMSVAAKMVGELVRLKDVSKWKIWAADSTDDFSNKVVPARVFKAAQNAMSNVEDAATKASAAVVGSETPATESIASMVKEKVADVSSNVADSISTGESLASQASSKASEAIVGAESDVESSSSTAAKSLESATDEVKETLEKTASSATETFKETASVATKAPRKVMGGAMAQILVEAREPILDDIIDDDEDAGTYSEKVQSMVADAGDRAADLTRAVSEALLGATKTQGSVESVTSLASEQYAKALAAASSVLYGTEQAPVESATSVASEQFAKAVTAASYAIYGTPTPTAIFKTYNVGASSRYNDAVSVANQQYSNAKSQLSLLISGKPKPAHETMLSIIDKAYSDSVAAASKNLQVALQYTDSVKSYAAGPTQGYLESVSSIAASKLSEGLSLASAQFTAKPTPALDGARRQYYEAVGLAHERYSEFLNAASGAVYGSPQGTIESLASVASASAASVASQVSSGVIGTETPWTESVASDVSGSAQSVASKASEVADSLASQVSSGVIGSETPWTESVASQASQNWEALIAAASTQVYGAPTPWANSVYSQVGAYGAEATAQAVEKYAAVQALISELVIGKEPDFTESVMNRFQSAYYTGIPAVVQSANSYASENIEAVTSIAGESYDAATSYAADAYASASSVISSVFTPPAAVETILAQATEQLNAAVASASVAVYGTTKGNVEAASESVASAYSSVQSQASVAIWGTQQASDSFAAVAASAQAAVSSAIFGAATSTGHIAPVASIYSSIASVASEKAEDAAAKASSAIYGPEQGAVESASSRLAAAVEAANSRIAEMYAEAAKTAGEAASGVSSVVTEATQRVRDEL